MRPSSVPLALFAFAGLSAAAPAGAAHSDDSCAGSIDSVPATITPQGTWCLRRDLSTAITRGAAIRVAANNVTIDCNGFKLGGPAAGNGSTSHGISAVDVQNAAVRHCSVRGFLFGILLSGRPGDGPGSGSGYVVEDNRLDNNPYTGIRVRGRHNLVRRNPVFDTGGHASFNDLAYGIDAEASIADSIVGGVFPLAANGRSIGIQVGGHNARVTGNQVSDPTVTGSGFGAGIPSLAPNTRIAGNHVANQYPVAGFAIVGQSHPATACLDNTRFGFLPGGIANCTDGGGNAGL